MTRTHLRGGREEQQKEAKDACAKGTKGKGRFVPDRPLNLYQLEANLRIQLETPHHLRYQWAKKK
jgi:hypothetical protein